jgi:3-oxoacyl-[acyl-carrier-protein] synthase III
MSSYGIIGTGHSVPDSSISNNDLVALGIDTSDEWIKTRTGIESRRISTAEETSSTFAVNAAKQAISDANISPDEIDLIIVATSTPDFQGFPSTACIVQEKLGIPICPAFDISAACTGFNYALTTALNFCTSGSAKKALVIGVDCLSKILDWGDRSTCVLFGDGAGAIVLSAVQEGEGIRSSSLFADGSESSILSVKNKQDTKEQFKLQTHIPYIYMEGQTVFKSAIKKVVPCVHEELKKMNLTVEDITLLIPHQANLRIIDHLQKRLKLRDDQVFTNVEKFGNTSAASIPLALFEATNEKRLKKGDILILLGFGAGFTWGINIIKWS